MSAELQTVDDRALADPAERIREEHRLALQHRDRAVEHGIECGRLLLQVKGRFARGEFVPWVKLHCGIERATAYRYLLAAQKVSTGVDVSSLSGMFPSSRVPRRSIGSEKPRQPAASVDPPSPPPTADDVLADDLPEGVSAEDAIPDDEELAALERAEREYRERVDQIIASDDRLAAALAENEKLGRLNVAVVQHRDRVMNGHAADIKRLKAAQNRADRLERQLQQANASIAKLREENEALRERIAVMEEGT